MKTAITLIAIMLYRLSVPMYAQDSDDKVYAAARCIRDMADLDLLDIITDENSCAAICKIEDQKSEHVDRAVLMSNADNSTNLRPLTIRWINTGRVIVLDALGAYKKPLDPIPYEIKSVTAFKQSAPGEENEELSPFINRIDCLSLIKLPKNVTNNSLDQYPQTYLITPEFYSQLKESLI